MIEYYILLVAAHCYGDFLLQTDRMAVGKHRLGVLSLHAAIHGILGYLVLQQWRLWPVLAAIFLVHGLIDFVKSRCPSNPRVFAGDQAAHLISLWFIAAMVQAFDGEGVITGQVAGRDWIVFGAGFVATVWGAGHFIAAVAEQLCLENPILREELKKGLKSGGAAIGRLERALIFVLFAVGQPAGVGFLVAAKSILRFEEAKKQPLAEYVLIGTLWSFGLAIAISALTLYLIHR